MLYHSPTQRYAYDALLRLSRKAYLRPRRVNWTYFYIDTTWFNVTLSLSYAYRLGESRGFFTSKTVYNQNNVVVHYKIMRFAPTEIPL